MLHSKVNINTVQAILGHSSVQTTMRYLHVLGGDVKEAGALFCLSGAVTPKDQFTAGLKLVSNEQFVELI